MLTNAVMGNPKRCQSGWLVNARDIFDFDENDDGGDRCGDYGDNNGDYVIGDEDAYDDYSTMMNKKIVV